MTRPVQTKLFVEAPKWLPVAAGGEFRVQSRSADSLAATYYARGTVTDPVSCSTPKSTGASVDVTTSFISSVTRDPVTSRLHLTVIGGRRIKRNKNASQNTKSPKCN